MRISDWSSDVCSSDLGREFTNRDRGAAQGKRRDDDVAAAAVLEAGIGERGGPVDAAADQAADALPGLAQELSVATIDLGDDGLAHAFTIGVVREVDHTVHGASVGAVGKRGGGGLG